MSARASYRGSDRCSLRWADRDRVPPGGGRRGRGDPHRGDAERRGGDADRDAGIERVLAPDAALLRGDVAGDEGGGGQAAGAGGGVLAERVSSAVAAGTARALVGGAHGGLVARLLGARPAAGRDARLRDARLLRGDVVGD